MNPESDKPDNQKQGLFFFGLPNLRAVDPRFNAVPQDVGGLESQSHAQNLLRVALLEGHLEAAKAENIALRKGNNRLQAEIERLNLALKQKPNEDLLADNSRLHKQLAECQLRIEDLQSVKRALSAEQDYADRIGRILNDREESLDACHRKIEEQAKELEVLWKQRDDLLDRLCAVESALYAGVPPAEGAE